MRVFENERVKSSSDGGGGEVKQSEMKCNAGPHEPHLTEGVGGQSPWRIIRIATEE